MTTAHSKYLVWALVGLIAFLAVSVSAQALPTPTTSDAAAPSSTAPVTIPSVTNRPGTNYTGPAPGEMDTLRSIIESYATGRASNPGSSPTPKADGPGSGAGTPAAMGSLVTLAIMTLTAAGFML